jgi:hypothetical protein
LSETTEPHATAAGIVTLSFCRNTYTQSGDRAQRPKHNNYGTARRGGSPLPLLGEVHVQLGGQIVGRLAEIRSQIPSCTGTNEQLSHRPVILPQGDV